MPDDQSWYIYQLIIERTGKVANTVTPNRDTRRLACRLRRRTARPGAVDRCKNDAYYLVVGGKSCRSPLKPELQR